MNNNDVEFIRGAAGGSDAHTPVDSPNSLVSKTTARVIFLTSDGEVGGLADQTNKLKSVYFNNVPVMNADGTMNFAHTQIDERYGLPSQSVMSGYPSASSTFNVGAKVTTTTPVTYTSSTSAPDAIRVTVRFPALFQQQSNGDTTGASVNFQIYSRLGAGSFTLIKDITKTDKCTSPADTDYLINRPAGAGTWSVKIVRVTSDNAATTLANDIYLQTAAEISYVQLPYNGRAYVGMTVTAEATGSSFPLISFDTYGIKIKVPSNYTVATRSYAGTWDGTFKTLSEVCDNPAWVLYDLLTNATHGMGSAIGPADVDQYSFYDSAVYNDGLVPALVAGSISGTEPRYTFNYQFTAQDSAWATIQNVAASFGAAVYTSGNRVKLVQDRPTNFSRIITNSNVVDGAFEYTSSQKSTRSTACIVYWNNPAENWLSVPCYYEDATGIARYGLNRKEVTGLGISTEGQALRLAKWHVDTSLNNLDGVVFKVGFANAGMIPGEVLKVMDTDYAQVMNEAKIISSDGTSTVTLDRAITVASGNTFDVVGADGVTVYTRAITSTGSLTTIAFTGVAITVLPGADFILTGSVSPRLFKVTTVKEESAGIYIVSGVEYDPNKFGRVDSTPTGNTPVFQAPTQIPSAPLNLAFRESSTNINNTVQRSLSVSWSRPAAGTVKNYVLRVRRSQTSWAEYTLNNTSYELQNVLEGTYEVQVYARSTLDVLGPQSTGSYGISSAGGSASLLNAPTGLTLIGGGTTFAGVDLNFQWTNPASNATVAATLRDFEVRFIETAGSTTVRTAYLQAVSNGAVQTGSYSFAMNTADGGPRRAMQLQVRCRDASNNLSAPVTVTFTNPTPAAITVTTNPGIANNTVKMTRPTDADFLGYLLWASTTSGFTPSLSNLVFEGNANAWVHSALTDSTTWYYRAAAYDVFAKDYAGAGLNVSTEASGMTAAGANVNEYELTGVTWTPNSPGANQVAWSACVAYQKLGTGMGASWAIIAGTATWASGILYVYYVAGNTTLNTTSSLSTALASSTNVIVATYRGGSNLEIGNGKAFTDGSFIIAGTVGATQVVSSGLITNSAQINNALINDAHFTGLLTAAKIDSRGLTIKDAAGTTILSAGVPLTTAYAAAGLVNSNISIASNGALSGGGGGAVTIGGLGYTGDLNATNDVLLVASAGITLKGNTAAQITGANWSEQVYSRDAYTGGAFASGVINSGSGHMFGLNTDPTTDASYTSIDYAIHTSTPPNLYAYESSVGTLIGSYAANDVLAVIYDNDYVRYTQNGNVLRSVKVGSGKKFYFDSSFASNAVLKNIRFGPMSAATTQGNLLDASFWNQANTPTNFWGSNNPGDGTVDVFAIGGGPSGNSEILWRATAGSGGNANGGWGLGNAANGFGNQFAVDPTKTYRFICPMFKGTSGTMYWGVTNSAVCDLNTATANTNPYFSSAVPAPGRWYLLVGYVYPAGSTLMGNQGSGCYDMVSGALIAVGLNFCWAASTLSASSRAYQFYASAGSQQWFGRPMVHIVNGDEPTLDSILASGSLSARNPITASNASTYIASAAIDLAQIKVASIGSLSALSANLGAVTAGTVHSVEFSTGAMTGYAWPAAGAGPGAYLGASGLLLGNYNDGKYFQVTAAGDIYAPAFTIVGGAATFFGRLSGASGTFSGTLSAVGVVTAANIVAGGLTSSYSSSSAGTAAAVSVTIPAGARGVWIHSDFGGALHTTTTGSGKTGTTVSYDGPANGNLAASPVLFGTLSASGSCATSVDSPGAGTYTFTATRTGGTTYYGVISIVVLVTNR